MPPAPLFAAFLLWAGAPAPVADGAPLTLYGVQLPDPLQVYTLQETKPENIRNDPFLVVFKTHIPSLRPYEIPYFPPKDYFSADAKDENSASNPVTSDLTEQTTVQVLLENDQEPESSNVNKVKPDDQIDLGKLPELVELKPEALLEALDASKQDLEEGQTSRPGGEVEKVKDDLSDIIKDAAENGTSGNKIVAESNTKTDIEKASEETNTSKSGEKSE